VSIASVIAQSINTFKKPKSNKEYDVGGYTGAGNKDKPAGIVHAGEWVAPQWQVKDKHSGPLIAMLEHQRRSKTRINPQVLQSMPKGYSSGGIVTEINSLKDNTKNDLMGALMGMYSVQDNKQNEILIKLAIAIEDLQKWKPKVYTEDIKKGLDNLDNIDRNRGM